MVRKFAFADDMDIPERDPETRETAWFIAHLIWSPVFLIQATLGIVSFSWVFYTVAAETVFLCWLKYLKG